MRKLINAFRPVDSSDEAATNYLKHTSQCNEMITSLAQQCDMKEISTEDANNILETISVVEGKIKDIKMIDPSENVYLYG
jgi:hypothetical protein